MRGLSAFCWLLTVSFLLNAFDGKWALDRADHGSAGVAGDLAVAVVFACIGVALFTTANRRAAHRAARQPVKSGATRRLAISDASSVLRPTNAKRSRSNEWKMGKSRCGGA